jgi:hypothetical protein
VIHADNIRPHCAKMVTQVLDHNSRRRAHHPPFPPDFAPQSSGFSGIWKECFKGVHSTNLMNSCLRSRKL